MTTLPIPMREISKGRGNEEKKRDGYCLFGGCGFHWGFVVVVTINCVGLVILSQFDINSARGGV